jgi:hypothetical protein
MPIVHFKGKVLPYEPTAFVIDIKDLPSVTWHDTYTGQDLKITTRIDASIIDIEFDCQVFEEKDFSSFLMRAWDIARAAVDLSSFKLAWGLSVIIETLIKPDGTASTILPKMETLAQYSTALSLSNPKINNFDICYRLLLGEPALFQAMNDLIVSITLPHHASVNCARAVEGLRVLMTNSAMDRKQAWPIFQTNLNIDRAYREYVTDVSTGPRHGDRAHIPGDVVNRTVERSWIIMNRFLEFRKRGNQQLPLSEFPLLTG